MGGVSQVLSKYASILYNFAWFISESFAKDMFEANKYVLAAIIACVPAATGLLFIILGVLIDWFLTHRIKAFLTTAAIMTVVFLTVFLHLIYDVYFAKSYQDFLRKSKQAIIVGHTDVELEDFTYDHVFTDYKLKLPNCKEILPLDEASGIVDLILIGPRAQYEQRDNVTVKKRIYLYFSTF